MSGRFLRLVGLCGIHGVRLPPARRRLDQPLKDGGSSGPVRQELLRRKGVRGVQQEPNRGSEQNEPSGDRHQLTQHVSGLHEEAGRGLDDCGSDLQLPDDTGLSTPSHASHLSLRTKPQGIRRPKGRWD